MIVPKTKNLSEFFRTKIVVLSTGSFKVNKGTIDYMKKNHKHLLIGVWTIKRKIQ